jgi:hypothetical protein
MLPLAGIRVVDLRAGEGRRVDKVLRSGMPAPALSLCPFPASGSREHSAGI